MLVESLLKYQKKNLQKLLTEIGTQSTWTEHVPMLHKQNFGQSYESKERLLECAQNLGRKIK